MPGAGAGDTVGDECNTSSTTVPGVARLVASGQVTRVTPSSVCSDTTMNEHTLPHSVNILYLLLLSTAVIDC